MKDTFALFAVVVTLLGWGAMAHAQKAKVSRIGYLAASSRDEPFVDAFRQGLRELGYIEGQNIVIEYRFADGKFDRLPELTAELLQLKVDVIVTAGGNATQVAQKATSTIPIVGAASPDPVRTGLVASLARPGGNVTDLSVQSPELSGKRLELLKEAVPDASRVAVLFNPTNISSAERWKEMEVAARSLGVKLQPIEVRGSEDLEKAFKAATKERARALIVARDFVIETLRGRIVDFAAKNKLPAMYEQGNFVEAGGLMSYGPSFPDLFRRAATYVDKILKGAKPGDLPVEQPTKFELIINLKTAKQIGLTIPPNVLARADRVIK
jgi:putative ABC transport system substrate-binding protein